MSQILFSVIVPTFNRAGMICEALQSVHAQTYQPIELIVVDDGSRDGTRTVVENWAQNRRAEDFRITYIYQENAGVCAARNRGVAAASGDYVQFLDSDDWLAPDRFAVIAEVVDRKRADFITTGFDDFDPDRNAITGRHPGNVNRDLIEQAMAGGLWGNALRCTYARQLLDRCGPWDGEFTCFEDREFSERALLMSERPVAIGDVLATARRHGGERLSSKLRTKEGRHFRIESEHRLLELAKRRGDVPDSSFAEFASRIYGLGTRSYASGWIAHGRRCGEIARRAEAAARVGLSSKGRQRRLAWRLGILGGQVYGLLGRLKGKTA